MLTYDLDAGDVESSHVCGSDGLGEGVGSEARCAGRLFSTRLLKVQSTRQRRERSPVGAFRPAPTRHVSARSRCPFGVEFSTTRSSTTSPGQPSPPISARPHAAQPTEIRVVRLIARVRRRLADATSAPILALSANADIYHRCNLARTSSPDASQCVTRPVNESVRPRGETRGTARGPSATSRHAGRPAREIHSEIKRFVLLCPTRKRQRRDECRTAEHAATATALQASRFSSAMESCIPIHLREREAGKSNSDALLHELKLSGAPSGSPSLTSPTPSTTTERATLVAEIQPDWVFGHLSA